MSNSSNTFLGLLAGTAIGALVGILYAPDKGSKTRQRLADEALAARDKINDGASELKDKVASNMESKKVTLDEQLDSFVKGASHKADDVISTLEKKLADLKAQNKKFQKS